MKVSRISVKALCRAVMGELAATMTAATILLFCLFDSREILLTGAVLMVCAMLWNFLWTMR